MKFFITCAAFGLLVGATAGLAQDDRWYQERESFYHGEHWRGHMFQRVREDLDRVQSKTFPVSRDEFRITRTKQELNELQGKLAAGRYDQPQLDDVISAMQRVVDSNKLDPRDRDMLSDDLNRMKDYREHHENWERR